MLAAPMPLHHYTILGRMSNQALKCQISGVRCASEAGSVSEGNEKPAEGCTRLRCRLLATTETDQEVAPQLPSYPRSEGPIYIDKAQLSDGQEGVGLENRLGGRILASCSGTEQSLTHSMQHLTPTTMRARR